MASVLMRNRRGTPSKEMKPCEVLAGGWWAETRAGQPQAPLEGPWPLELEEAGTDAPLEAREGSQPRIPPSQTSVLQSCERTHFCCFQPPVLWGFAPTAPGSLPSAGGAHPLCSCTCPDAGVSWRGCSEALCFLSLSLRPGGLNGPLTPGTNTDNRLGYFVSLNMKSKLTKT